MLLNSAWLLRSERPCVLKGLWAIYLERERQRAFRPSFFFGAQKETTNDSFLKSREEGLICFLAVETLEEHRPEQRWLCLCSWFSHSYSRIRWSTAKNVFEENKLFNLFFYVVYLMDVGRKMNECDGLSYARMNLRTSSLVALFYLYISTFF